jgi:FHS family glucose/mannose:H+ symporter-like MFS transporter
VTGTKNLRWLSGTAYAGMFGFGIVMAILGAILPVIAGRIHINLAKAGDLFLLMNAAMLATTLIAGPVVDRFGHRWLLITGACLVAFALWMIAQAKVFAGLRAAVVVLGLGGGMLNQTTNTLISDVYPEWRQKTIALNLLGVFFGIGALFVPFAVGSLFQQLGLRTILYLTSGVVLIPAVLGLVLAFPEPQHRSSIPLVQAAPLLKQPLIWALAFLLFFESGNEFIIGGYLATYFTSYFGLSMSFASYLLAIYWGAIMMGRIVIGRMRIHPVRLVQGSAIGAAGGMLMVLLASPSWALAVGVILLGLGSATIFPTVLAEAGSWFPDYSGTVFGILIGVALTGGITLPWITGGLSQHVGIHSGLTLVILDAIAVCALQTLGNAMHEGMNARCAAAQLK